MAVDKSRKIKERGRRQKGGPIKLAFSKHSTEGFYSVWFFFNPNDQKIV